MVQEKTKLEQLKRENEELECRLKRVLADYANLERRVAEDREKIVKITNEKLLLEFFPILDNLERSAKNNSDQGLQLVLKQFQDVLSSHKVTAIEAVGQNFDPNLHEAVEVVGEGGKVTEVLENGYRLGEKVIRPAKVRVG